MTDRQNAMKARPERNKQAFTNSFFIPNWSTPLKKRPEKGDSFFYRIEIYQRIRGENREGENIDMASSRALLFGKRSIWTYASAIHSGTEKGKSNLFNIPV